VKGKDKEKGRNERKHILSNKGERGWGDTTWIMEKKKKIQQKGKLSSLRLYFRFLFQFLSSSTPPPSMFFLVYVIFFLHPSPFSPS
jgi:hypothetical protein